MEQLRSGIAGIGVAWVWASRTRPDSPPPAHREKERTISRPAITISLVAEYGWCRLTVEGRRRTVGISATTLHDALRDLVVALRHFTEGTTDVSVRWGGEPGGVFLQLSHVYQASEDLCGVAIQEFMDENWITNNNWLPVRGTTIFTDVVPSRVLLDAFLVALRSVHQQPTDESGKIEHWGWSFPHEEFSALEDLVRRMAQSD